MLGILFSTRFPADRTRNLPLQRREAWEECGVPIDPKRVQKLCELRPFLSANELVVTPVVMLITDPNIQVSSRMLQRLRIAVRPHSLRLRVAHAPHRPRRPPSTQKPRLNPQEVSSIFSLPLASFLHHDPPASMRGHLRLPPKPSAETLKHMPRTMTMPTSDWHTCRDAMWLGRRCRRHTFWDTRNPVMGLTR